MQSLQREAPDIEEVYVCGGGAFNLFLMERLATHFSGTVTTTSALGIHPDHVEGAAFAWLAEQFLAHSTHIKKWFSRKQKTPKKSDLESLLCLLL